VKAKAARHRDRVRVQGKQAALPVANPQSAVCVPVAAGGDQLIERHEILLIAAVAVGVPETSVGAVLGDQPERRPVGENKVRVAVEPAVVIGAELLVCVRQGCLSREVKLAFRLSAPIWYRPAPRAASLLHTRTETRTSRAALTVALKKTARHRGYRPDATPRRSTEPPADPSRPFGGALGESGRRFVQEHAQPAPRWGPNATHFYGL
jgi:hypothetical protein